jgi:hypothetical protein
VNTCRDHTVNGIRTAAADANHFQQRGMFRVVIRYFYSYHDYLITDYTDYIQRLHRFRIWFSLNLRPAPGISFNDDYGSHNHFKIRVISR